MFLNLTSSHTAEKPSEGKQELPLPFPYVTEIIGDLDDQTIVSVSSNVAQTSLLYDYYENITMFPVDDYELMSTISPTTISVYDGSAGTFSPTNRTTLSPSSATVFEELMKLFKTNVEHIYSNSEVSDDSSPHLCGAQLASPLHHSFWERTTLITSGLSCAGLVALLNLCVIVTFIKCAELRRTAQNLYILNLAICDFCVGLNSLPGVTLYFYNMCWPYGVKLCQIMTSMDWITSTETGVSMCLIAYDRLQLVELGALYAQHENRAVVVRKILLSWMVVILVLLPGMLMPFFTGVSVNANGDCINEIYQIEVLGTAVACLTGIVPPLALAIIYYSVYGRLGATSRARRRSFNFNTDKIARETRRARRAARGMYLLSAMFFASWIPPTLNELAMSVINNTQALHFLKPNESVALRMATFFKFWIYLNSLLNPFLYAFAFRAIRSGMEKTFLPIKYQRKLEQRRRQSRRQSTQPSNEPRRKASSWALAVSTNTLVGRKLLKSIAGRSFGTSGGSNQLVSLTDNRRLSVPLLSNNCRFALRASMTSTSTAEYHTKSKGPDAKFRSTESAPPINGDSKSGSCMVTINLAAINYNTIHIMTEV